MVRSAATLFTAQLGSGRGYRTLQGSESVRAFLTSTTTTASPPKRGHLGATLAANTKAAASTSRSTGSGGRWQMSSGLHLLSPLRPLGVCRVASLMGLTTSTAARHLKLARALHGLGLHLLLLSAQPHSSGMPLLMEHVSCWRRIISNIWTHFKCCSCACDALRCA